MTSDVFLCSLRDSLALNVHSFRQALFGKRGGELNPFRVSVLDVIISTVNVPPHLIPREHDITFLTPHD